MRGLKKIAWGGDRHTHKLVSHGQTLRLPERISLRADSLKITISNQFKKKNEKKNIIFKVFFYVFKNKKHIIQKKSSAIPFSPCTG